MLPRQIRRRPSSHRVQPRIVESLSDGFFVTGTDWWYATLDDLADAAATTFVKSNGSRATYVRPQAVTDAPNVTHSNSWQTIVIRERSRVRSRSRTVQKRRSPWINELDGRRIEATDVDRRGHGGAVLDAPTASPRVAAPCLGGSAQPE